MRVWAKLLLIALPLLGCNGETFQKGNEKSAIVDSPLEDKDSRPQETGEGLPGYLFCNSQDVSDSQTDLSCRIEADQKKVDLSGQKVVWNYTNTPGVTLNTLVQEISSPWACYLSITRFRRRSTERSGQWSRSPRNRRRILRDSIELCD